MKIEELNEDWKCGGLHNAAQRLKDNKNDAVLWQSAQRGAKDMKKGSISPFLCA